VFLNPVTIVGYAKAVLYPSREKSTGHKITLPVETALPELKDELMMYIRGYKTTSNAKNKSVSLAA
jgi:hypothetical protein